MNDMEFWQKVVIANQRNGLSAEESCARADLLLRWYGDRNRDKQKGNGKADTHEVAALLESLPSFHGRTSKVRTDEWNVIVPIIKRLFAHNVPYKMVCSRLGKSSGAVAQAIARFDGIRP